jgi:RNA polymerase sigma-70 factor (ECF subfamily)
VPPHSENAAAAEETALLAQVGLGDRGAFRLLYARYSAPLLSLGVRLLGNVGDAEEMLQDTFVKIWRNAASYDSHKSRPFTWAVTIMRRTCIDHLRRRHRLPAVIPFLDDALTGAEPAAGDSTRRSAEAGEDSERIHGAIAAAPPNQRRALELALFSGMTHPEIARRLEQPVGTVKSWIRRGLLELRATLTESAP